MHTSREMKPPLVGDPILLFVTIGIVIFSLVMIYSTTGILSEQKFGDSLYYVRRQILAAVAGTILMVGLSFVNMEWVRSVSRYMYPLCVIALAATLIPGLGLTAGGARRWINLRVTVIQPGEVVKLFFIIYIAGYFHRHEHELHRGVVGVVRPAMLVGILALLFLLQPDFGSTSVVVAVTLTMMVVAGVRLAHVGMAALGASIAGVLLVVFSPYRLARVMSVFNPAANPAKKNYQLEQSWIALGSGNVLGTGIGASKQKLFFLPAAHTDFILSVVGEELGFVGCVVLILAFVVLLWRGLLLARRLSHDCFALCLAFGLTMMIVLPAFLNMGVVSGLLPTKGMVLPLVGYGGSSLVCCLAGVGLLLALARSHQRGML